MPRVELRAHRSMMIMMMAIHSIRWMLRMYVCMHVIHPYMKAAMGIHGCMDLFHAYVQYTYMEAHIHKSGWMHIYMYVKASCMHVYGGKAWRMMDLTDDIIRKCGGWMLNVCACVCVCMYGCKPFDYVQYYNDK